MTQLFKENFFDNVIVVSGIHSSGSSMISPIVSSLNRVEHFRKISTIEQIVHLFYLKKIKKNVAIFLIKQILDKSFYEQAIGRNLNLRFDDETSVFNSKNSKKIFNRFFSKKGPKIIDKFLNQKIFFCLDVHEVLVFFNLWKDINKKFKFINIYRNPVDIVASWYKHRMGIIEKTLVNEIVMLKAKKNIYPFYHLEKSSYYNNISEMDKIINMVIFNLKKEYANYRKYKNNKKCLFIEFDDFAINTNKNIEKICIFLKTKKSNYTNIVLKKENCPRIINPNELNEKLKTIKYLSSLRQFNKLMNFQSLFLKRKNQLI